MTKRSITLDATALGSLRVGINWDALERDTLDHKKTFKSRTHVWIELVIVYIQIVLLFLLACLFRVSLVLWKLAKYARNSRRSAQARKNLLEKYLGQKHLASYDLDLCCFCYGRDGALIGFVLPSITEMGGSVGWNEAFMHSGDDDTGTGKIFDELLQVNFERVDVKIDRLFFLAVSLNHGFNDIKGGTWSMVNTKGEEEILSSAFTTPEKKRLCVMADVKREGAAWKVSEILQFYPLVNNKNLPLQGQVDRLIREKLLANAEGNKAAQKN